jgi:hypothetical protein
MDARRQLQDLQSALGERGVQDIKFCFAKGKAVPMSYTQQDAVSALKAFLGRKYHPLPPAGDSVKAKNK